ncbi:MAG: exonuclease domain-containing protein [bacterium]
MKQDNEICEYLRQQIFVAFDTETTGLWAPSNRIVEIGAVKFRPGDKKSEKFQTLVNPQKPIPPEVIKIHHITDADVADAPLAKEVMEDFIDFCGNDSILIAHNAPFDISFVGCELDRYEMKFGENIVIDTTDIFRRYYPSLASYSLLSLAQHFSIVDIQSHRALADAVIVQRLFEIAAPKLGNIKQQSDLDHILSTYKMDDWRARNATLPDQYADLNRALDQKQRISIIYATPSNEPTSRVIQPRNFYQLGQVYYIMAYCERVNDERTFRLDRIREYKVLE